MDQSKKYVSTAMRFNPLNPRHQIAKKEKSKSTAKNAKLAELELLDLLRQYPS